jgi:hypothetical protein
LRFKRADAVPPQNRHVFRNAKAILGGEVLAVDPWPETGPAQILIRNAWTKARMNLKEEMVRLYGVNFVWREGEPDHEPDAVSEHIVFHPTPCWKVLLANMYGY